MLLRFEENHMMRMMRKRKSQDTGRSNRQEIDDLTDFSEFRTITRDVSIARKLSLIKQFTVRSFVQI